MVCRQFYGGLEMVRVAAESDRARHGLLTPPNPNDCNYRIALMHRSEAEKKHVQAPLKVGSSHHSQRRTQENNRVASFAEVVGDFARQQDISFYPKVGPNATKDGKKVFMFGNHPVYMDKNVLFTLRGATWQPISLEHLAQALIQGLNAPPAVYLLQFSLSQSILFDRLWPFPAAPAIATMGYDPLDLFAHHWRCLNHLPIQALTAMRQL